MLEFNKLNGGEGMSKSETGLQSLSQGSQIRVWNGEGWAGSSMQSSKNRTKVCGWMGYAVGDLRTSLGHGDVWIGVLVQCYMECNIQDLMILSGAAHKLKPSLSVRITSGILNLPGLELAHPCKMSKELLRK